jgi:hypothetical protein
MYTTSKPKDLSKGSEARQALFSDATMMACIASFSKEYSKLETLQSRPEALKPIYLFR